VDNSSQAVFSSDPGDPWVRAAPYNNMGWAGGWLFAYSAEDFSVKFDPYWFRNAPVDSRARAMTVRMPCDRLPEAEKEGCNGSALTQITNGITRTEWFFGGETGPRPGAFMPSWAATIPETTIYTLQTDPPLPGQGTWGFKQGIATKQNQLPVMVASGYYYEQSPFKLNNCPNCNPLGLSNDDRHPDSPYILPVNADDDGNPFVYSYGKPVLQDVNGNSISEADLETIDLASIKRDAENRPIAAGYAIELVEVIVKYLASMENQTLQAADFKTNRVTPVEDGALPDYSESLGHPMMQPLCGTIPVDYASVPKNEAEAQAFALRKCWE